MAVLTKVSDVTKAYLAQYLRIDQPDTAQLDELDTMLTSAIGYLSSATGLPSVQPTRIVLDANGLPVLDVDGKVTAESDPTVRWIDSNAEFVMAVCVLVQNQYDNRSFYTDKGQVESVINDILGMHRVNLI